jgi:hypothetical protein
MEQATATKLEAVKKACKEDLKFLCVNVLGFSDWDIIHDQMRDYLKNAGRQKLILIPRGHLKSSIVTVGYAIQRILKNPDIRILITNATWDNSRKFLGQISEMMTGKSLLTDIFGSFKGDGRWTLEELTVAQRVKATKEPTISTAGIEKSLTSQHYDLIIHDDLVNRENITTREQKEKVLSFYKDSLSLLDPGGEMSVIGTRWATDDLYGHLLENDLESMNGVKLEGPEEKATWRKWIKQ